MSFWETCRSLSPGDICSWPAEDGCSEHAVMIELFIGRGVEIVLLPSLKDARINIQVSGTSMLESHVAQCWVE